MDIPVGFACGAGCTPDGACWPDFVTTRPAIVRDLLDVPHWKRGTLWFDRARDVWVIFVDPTPTPNWKWRRQDIICHELGHMECVTVHKDGERWCRK